ncbi:MAG TPA: fumarylacetoacetate hydrolase family protein [Novosphingobium sp.]|nr:fumarylacetoacetate hydrolase family protein [Novosphingobium sp.]HZV09262.1 fumarylacetoacetate hydrolase family protein [Novosphingobium sp.]
MADISNSAENLTVARIGRRVLGIGQAARAQLGLSQPAFGAITADMLVDDTDAVPMAGGDAPLAVATLAFLLERDLAGGEVDIADVLEATALVFPAIEVRDPQAAAHGFGAHVVLGDGGLAPAAIDLECCGVVAELNGALAATGAGAAALGHPAKAVAWLANALDAQGDPLRAGEIVLAGELTAPVAVKAGDALRVTVGGLGNAGLRFE